MHSICRRSISTTLSRFFFNRFHNSGFAICCVFPHRPNNQSFHLSLARRSSLWSSRSPLHRESQRQPRVPGEVQVRGHLRPSGPADLPQSRFRAHRLTAALPVRRHVDTSSVSSSRLLLLLLCYMVVSFTMLQSMNWSLQLTRVQPRASSAWRYGNRQHLLGGQTESDAHDVTGVH